MGGDIIDRGQNNEGQRGNYTSLLLIIISIIYIGEVLCY